MKLKNERVLLTGGAGGIGALISQRLIKAGADLTVLDRCDALPFEAAHIKADLSTPDGIEAAAAAIAEKEWDVLINLAGVQYFGPFENQPADRLLQTYLVNLVAPARLTQAVLPGMRARKHGRIANIGSVFGSINFAHFAAYSSSKAGLRGLTHALRRETAGSGISFTYVAPRAVKTPLNTEQVLRFAALTKMRMDKPEKVARLIVSAVRWRRKEVVIGFPESLFVKINAIAPSVVDQALFKGDRAAAALFAA